MPYEEWEARFGARCGICGREASGVRRLDRDHDHRTGEPRGLLCHLCNRALGNRTLEWLRAAVYYMLPRCERCGNKIGDGVTAHGPGFCIDRRGALADSV